MVFLLVPRTLFLSAAHPCKKLSCLSCFLLHKLEAIVCGYPITLGGLIKLEKKIKTIARKADTIFLSFLCRPLSFLQRRVPVRKNFKSSRKAYSDTASLDVSKAKSTVVVCPFFCKKSRVHLLKKLKPLRKAYATSSQNVVL